MINIKDFQKLRSYKTVNLLDLQPYSMNSRIHSDQQINQIINSIKEFGFTNPCLIDEKNNLIAGHGRVEAAKKLGFIDIPCIVIDKLTEAQRKTLIIADNKLALNADWDFDLLKTEFEFLTNHDFNLELTGFDSKEIDAIFSESEEKDLTDYSDSFSEKHQVVIDCIGEREQKILYDRLTKEGYACKVMSL